jgi:hypothetical protein
MLNFWKVGMGKEETVSVLECMVLTIVMSDTFPKINSVEGNKH